MVCFKGFVSPFIFPSRHPLWPYFEYDSRYSVEMFYRYLEYTVSRFCDQNISAHTLDIFAELLYLEQIQLFGHCLELLIEKALQVLMTDVDNWDKNLPMFRLPNTLFSASLLTSLMLINCELPSLLMVGLVQLKSFEIVVAWGYADRRRTFCVKRHHNLQKVEIYNTGLERIDVDAPNLYILTSPVHNLKLSRQFLKRLELQSDCNLEEIDLNAPNLLLFKYNDVPSGHSYAALDMSRKDSSLAKGMKCHKGKDILTFFGSRS
ncbi:hypothetical protein Tco_0425561 [Tanacetum coccineum]